MGKPAFEEMVGDVCGGEVVLGHAGVDVSRVDVGEEADFFGGAAGDAEQSGG